MMLTETNNCRVAINRHDAADNIARKRQLPHRQNVLTKVRWEMTQFKPATPWAQLTDSSDLEVEIADGTHGFSREAIWRTAGSACHAPAISTPTRRPPLLLPNRIGRAGV